MRIEYQNMQTIGNLAQSKPLLIKHLNQLERKVVKATLEALKRGEPSVLVKGFGAKQLDRLTAKLSLPVHPKKEDKSVSKGLANLLGLRVSSASLLRSIKDLDPKLFKEGRDSRLKQVSEQVRACRNDIARLKRSLAHDRFLVRTEYKMLKKLQREEKALTEIASRLSRPLLSDRIASIDSAIDKLKSQIDHHRRQLDLMVERNQFWRGLVFKKDPYEAFQAQEKLIAKQLFAIVGRLIQDLEGSSEKTRLGALKEAYALPFGKRSEYHTKLQALDEALLPYRNERVLFKEWKGYAEIMDAILKKAMRTKPTKGQLKQSILEFADKMSREDMQINNKKFDQLHRSIEQDRKKLDALLLAKAQLEKMR